MVLALAVAYALGPWVWATALLGMVLAWIYSAPPLRLKGNAGSATWRSACPTRVCPDSPAPPSPPVPLPDARVVTLALLYSLGTHGIMTLNDFKSVEGDLVSGVGSLPARLGVDRACLVMTVPQLVMTGLLLHWNLPVHAVLVAILAAA